MVKKRNYIYMSFLGKTRKQRKTKKTKENN